MNNYVEIALDAIKNITNTDNPAGFASSNKTVFDVAVEAARLQAEQFNKDLDESYINSLTNEAIGL